MRPLKYGGLVGAAAAIIIGGSALATTPALVGVDLDTTDTPHAYTAASNGPIGFSSGSAILGCTSATAAGDVFGGTSRLQDLLDVQSSTWTGCIGPGSIPMTVTMTSTPWTFTMTGSTATPGSSDVIAGYVGGIDAHVASASEDVTCEFDVVGFASATFDEEVLRDAGPPVVNGQDLVINETGDTGNLYLDNVVCGGLLNDEDPANFTGTFNIGVTGAVSDQPINVQ